MTENLEENILEEGDTDIYEIGYHLLPTIGDENMLVESSKIKEMILGSGGQFVSEGVPSMKQLAYPMIKKHENKNLNFTKAYFGWVKFEAPTSKIEEINKNIEANQNVLRFLTIKTVKESTLYTPKAPMFKKEEHKGDIKVDTEELPVENKAPVSETEIDKSIDDLVTTIN